MARRKIDDDTIGQARAMVRSGMSIKRVAAQTGLSRDTVSRYSKGELPKAADIMVVDQVESGHRDRIKSNVENFLVKATDIAASDEFVVEMARKPKDLLIGIGIGIEKNELLSGRPTGISEQQRVLYVVGNPLRDASLVAIGRTDPAQPPALEAEYVVTQDKEPSV